MSGLDTRLADAIRASARANPDSKPWAWAVNAVRPFLEEARAEGYAQGHGDGWRNGDAAGQEKGTAEGYAAALTDARAAIEKQTKAADRMKDDIHKGIALSSYRLALAAVERVDADGVWALDAVARLGKADA